MPKTERFRWVNVVDHLMHILTRGAPRTHLSAFGLRGAPKTHLSASSLLGKNSWMNDASNIPEHTCQFLIYLQNKGWNIMPPMGFEHQNNRWLCIVRAISTGFVSVLIFAEPRLYNLIFSCDPTLQKGSRIIDPGKKERDGLKHIGFRYSEIQISLTSTKF